MAIRTMLVACLAAVLSVSTPVVLAEQPVEQQAPPLTLFEMAKQKVFGVADAAQEKYSNLTDPEHKIAALKQEILDKDREIDALQSQLVVQDVRVQVQLDDMDKLRQAIKDIHYLVVTGRLDALVKELVPQLPPVIEMGVVVEVPAGT